MPYIFVSTQIRLENGPTNVGDEHSDKAIMDALGAELMHHKGNPFKEYTVSDPPRIVLNRLAEMGYHVVTTAGIGQTIVWTTYKPEDRSL